MLTPVPLITAVPRVVTVPGIVACTTASIQTSDGTLEPLTVSDVVELTVEDPAVAVVGERSDCRFADRLALIGVSPGTTRAQVVVRRAGLIASATVSVMVFDSSYELRPLSFSAVVVGGAVGLPGVGGDVAARVLGTVPTDLQRCDCGLARRWLSFESESPSVLTVTGSPGQFVARGVSAGTAAVRVTYRPVGSAPRSASASVHVGEGSLVNVSVRLGKLEGVLPESLTGPGACVSATAVANFLGSRNFFDVPTTGASWLAGPGLHVTVSGNPARVCATAVGATTLRACYRGQCGTTSPVVPGGPTPIALTATVTDANLQPGGGNLASIHVCPRVRLVASLSDQTSLDVTSSPHVQWRATWGTAPWSVTRALRPDGSTAQDANGNPCLQVEVPGGRWSSGTARFNASYLGQEAGFDQVFVF